jgi:hypothetical protein
MKLTNRSSFYFITIYISSLLFFVIGATAQQLSPTQSTLEEAKTLVREKEQQLSSAKTELDKATAIMQATEQEIAVIAKELSSATAALQTAEQVLQKETEQLAAQRSRREEELRTVEAKQKEVDQQLVAARKALDSAKASQQAAEQQLASAQTELETATVTHQQAEQAAQQIAAQVERVKAEISTAGVSNVISTQANTQGSMVVDGSIDTPKPPEQPTDIQRRYYRKIDTRRSDGTRTDLIKLLKLRNENGTKMCEDLKCNKLGDMRGQGGKCFITEQRKLGRLICTEVEVPLAPCTEDQNTGAIRPYDFKLKKSDSARLEGRRLQVRVLGNRETSCGSYTIPPETRVENAKKVIDLAIQVYLAACKDNPSKRQKRVRGRKVSHDPDRHRDFHKSFCSELPDSGRANQIEYLGSRLRIYNNDAVKLLTVRLREINESIREQTQTRLGNGLTQSVGPYAAHQLGPQGVNGEGVVNALNCIDPEYTGPNLTIQTSCLR